jgi:hypothetical protein
MNSKTRELLLSATISLTTVGLVVSWLAWVDQHYRKLAQAEKSHEEFIAHLVPVPAVVAHSSGTSFTPAIEVQVVDTPAACIYITVVGIETTVSAIQKNGQHCQ